MLPTISPTLLLLSACLAAATPVSVLLENSALNWNLNPLGTYPGYSLNLQDLRLVQLQPDGDPVWWTELEKVSSPIHVIYIYLLNLS